MIVYLVDTLTVSKPVDEGRRRSPCLAFEHRLASDGSVRLADGLRVGVDSVEEDPLLRRLNA